MCRYLSWPNSNGTPSWKSLTKSEATNLRAQGIDIVSNWESNGTTEVRGGHASGVSVAKEALKLHNACGGPANAAVYFSVDWDASSSDITKYVIPYIQGAVSVLGFDRVGVYGSYAVIQKVTGKYCKYGWQTYAWSGGKVSSKAHLYQYQNGVLNGQADRDKTLKADFGSWGTTPKPAPAPKPKNVDSNGKTTDSTALSAWNKPVMRTDNPDHPFEWPVTTLTRIDKNLKKLLPANPAVSAALDAAKNVDARGKTTDKTALSMWNTPVMPTDNPDHPFEWATTLIERIDDEVKTLISEKGDA